MDKDKIEKIIRNQKFFTGTVKSNGYTTLFVMNTYTSSRGGARTDGYTPVQGGFKYQLKDLEDLTEFELFSSDSLKILRPMFQEVGH